MAKRILLLDPNISETGELEPGLRSLGYELSHSDIGQGAKGVDSFRPDIVILHDLSTQKDVIDFIHSLRGNRRLGYSPVIAVAEADSAEMVIRVLGAGVDDFVRKPCSVDELVARIEAHLRRTRLEKGRNPVTGLPGNLAIEDRLKELVAENGSFVVLYIDMDGFKSYNDTYGFLQGDDVIRLLAQIITTVVAENGNDTDFVGHIGGDDFVICTTPEKYDSICQHTLRAFDQSIKKFYSLEHRQQGYVLALDRKGQEMRHGFVTLSIAVVTNEHRDIESHWEIGEIAAELKHVCKKVEESIYVVDQRGSKQGEVSSAVRRQAFFHLKPTVVMLDHEVLAKTVALAFARAGLPAQLVFNSDSYFEALRQHEPRAVVLDAELLGGQFTEAIERSRRHGVGLCVYVGDPLLNDRKKADLTFEKPLQIARLINALKEFYACEPAAELELYAQGLPELE
jgi:diguanylate cyclase (GGDEF)-like protein